MYFFVYICLGLVYCFIKYAFLYRKMYSMISNTSFFERDAEWISSYKKSVFDKIFGSNLVKKVIFDICLWPISIGSMVK